MPYTTDTINYSHGQSNSAFLVRPGYSTAETFKAYNRITSADGGRAGSRLTTVDELKSTYAEALRTIHSHPDNESKDDDNKDNILDMDAVDWLEILISCHHMHGRRLDGSPLAVHGNPDIWG